MMMDLDRAHKAIRQIAEREGISEAQVAADMEHAMEEARKAAYRSGDPKKIALWESICRDGKIPTAYEFVEYFSNFIQNMR